MSHGMVKSMFTHTNILPHVQSDKETKGLLEFRLIALHEAPVRRHPFLPHPNPPPTKDTICNSITSPSHLTTLSSYMNPLDSHDTASLHDDWPRALRDKKLLCVLARHGRPGAY